MNHAEEKVEFRISLQDKTRENRLLLMAINDDFTEMC